MKTAATDISKLLVKIKSDCAAMVDAASAKIFRSVSALVFNPKARNTPFLGIFLLEDPDRDYNNIGCFTNYRFKLSVGIKSANEAKIIDEISYVRSKLKNFFQNDPDYSAIVSGYTQMTVEGGAIRDETPEGLAGVMIWDTGLILDVEVEREIK